MRIRFLTLLVLFAVTAFAHADNWDKTYTVGANAQLKVDTNDASIHVSGGDGNRISARVWTDRDKIGPNDVRVEEKQTGDTVELFVRVPRHRITIGTQRRGVHIEVSVPTAVALDLRSGDGEIRVNGIHGPAKLNTGDGSIEIDGYEGSLLARTSDGHIRADGRFDDLDVTTSDGHIECVAREGSRINDRWNLRTSDGSVRLRMPQTLAADVTMHTSDGHIQLDLPVTVEGRYSKKDLRGKLNGGGHPLEISTSDGSITLEKL